MVTYWLTKRLEDGDIDPDLEADSESLKPENDDQTDQMELPGEITTVEDPLYSASLNYPMPGRPTKASSKDEGKNTARVAPTVAGKGKKMPSKEIHS